MSENKKNKELNAIFDALANEHRREIIHRLSLQPASISQLADMRKLSLPAIHKHIKVLEKTQFIHRKKIGRTHFLSLNREALLKTQEWLLQFQAFWGSDKETLENYAQYLEKDKFKQRKKK